MTTEARSESRRFHWRQARGLGWAAALGILLLAPQELPAQKDKTSTGSSAKSSAPSRSSVTRSSPSRSSPPPSRSSSASRSSGSSSRKGSVSRATSRASRAKSSTKASRRATSSRGDASRKIRATQGVAPKVKPDKPTRTAVENDEPGRAGEKPSQYRSGDRHRRPGSHHRHPYYPYYPYYPYGYGYYSSYYPYYFYGPYGYFFHPYAYGYGYGPGYRRGPRHGDAMGGLDLNVKPKKAEVYIDGTPVGEVDRYDGFPSYLWLEPGAYELAFYLEGYETLVRRYTIYPGVVVDVKERLVPGAAVEPEPPELGGLSFEEGEIGAAPPAAAPSEGGATVGRLRLSIRPGDTAVYLDGQFLGTGEELAQLSAGLVVEPGDHVLELVRPGYVTEQVPIQVPAGDRIDVDLTLRPR